MDQRPAEAPGEGRRRISTAQKRLIGFIVVLAVTNVAYRPLQRFGMGQAAGYLLDATVVEHLR